MKTQHHFRTAMFLAAMLAVIGCSNGRETNVAGGGSETPGSIVGQVPAQTIPIDSSLASNQETTETPGLAPSSPNGQQNPGVLNTDGSFPGSMPGMFPPGFYPGGQLLPYYQPPQFSFSNPNVLRFFLCISLVAPYNNGITAPTVQQLVQRWNLIMSFALKVAGRLFNPTEMAGHLQQFVSVDSVSAREAAAWRIILSTDHTDAVVGAVFSTFLRRDPRADELTAFGNQLKGGQKFEDFVIQIAGSQERFALVFASTSARTTNAKITGVILDTYAKILGRQASTTPSATSEHAFWFNWINDRRREGKTLQEALTLFVEGVVRSDENRRRVAEHTVKRLYEANDANLIRQAFDKLKASNGDLFGVMKWLFGTEEYKTKFWLKYVPTLTAQWCNDNAGDFFSRWF